MLTRHTILDDVGDLAAPPGSRPWSVAVRLEVQTLLKDNESSVNHLKIFLEGMRKYEGYRTLEDPDGKPFLTYETFCTTRQPFGLGYDVDDINRIVRERESAQTKAAEAREILSHEEAGRLGGRGNKASSVTTSFIGRGGDYLASVIKTNHPEIHDRMLRGEYKSVRSAALEAGIVKPRVSVQTTADGFARAIRRYLAEEDIERLIELLESD